MIISGRGGQHARGGLLHPDHHPFHHPRLLHRPHRQPAEEEDGGRPHQAEEGRVPGHLGHGGLLLLLPALHHRPHDPADHACAGGERAGAGPRRRGLRRPHGAVLHGLPDRPAHLLLLQHQVQGPVPEHLLQLLWEERPGGQRELHGQQHKFTAQNPEHRHLNRHLRKKEKA